MEALLQSRVKPILNPVTGIRNAEIWLIIK